MQSRRCLAGRIRHGSRLRRFLLLLPALALAAAGLLIATPPDRKDFTLLPGEPEKADLVRAREMLEH